MNDLYTTLEETLAALRREYALRIADFESLGDRDPLDRRFRHEMLARDKASLETLTKMQELLLEVDLEPETAAYEAMEDLLHSTPDL